jgi:predicted DNA-binding transcriptional regulator AlpA
MDGYITEATFRALLGGVSRGTVVKWAKRGYGPDRVKLGPRRVGYAAQAVQAFLASRATVAPGKAE